MGDDDVWEPLRKTWTISIGNVAVNGKVRVYEDVAGNEDIYFFFQAKNGRQDCVTFRWPREVEKGPA